MTFKLMHWMRLVLPRFEMAMVFLICVLTFEGLQLAVVLRGWNPEDGRFGDLRVVLYIAVALFYGIFRAVAFHPESNGDYRRWLENTPWTARHPLPAGPITLVPQDLVVILLLMGLCQDWSLRVFYIPAAFLSCYQGVLAIINWHWKEWALAYAVGFGIGTECFFIRQPELLLAIAAAYYPLTWLAVRRSLQRFPWQKTQLSEAIDKSITRNSAQNSLGWPYNALAPQPPSDIISRHDAICLSLLVGWWHLSILWGSDVEVRLGLILFPLMFLLFAPLIRVAVYQQGYRSPIDLWGRLRTGRLIIPAYDCVWIGSLVAWIVGIGLYSKTIALAAIVSGPGTLLPRWMLDSRQLYGWQINLVPLGTTLAMMSLLLIGPGLRRWQLTGQHRMVFALARKEFIEL